MNMDEYLEVAKRAGYKQVLFGNCDNKPEQFYILFHPAGILLKTETHTWEGDEIKDSSPRNSANIYFYGNLRCAYDHGVAQNHTWADEFGNSAFNTDAREALAHKTERIVNSMELSKWTYDAAKYCNLIFNSDYESNTHGIANYMKCLETVGKERKLKLPFAVKRYCKFSG